MKTSLQFNEPIVEKQLEEDDTERDTHASKTSQQFNEKKVTLDDPKQKEEDVKNQFKTPKNQIDKAKKEDLQEIDKQTEKNLSKEIIEEK